MKIKLGHGKVNMEQIAEWCMGELYDFCGEGLCEFEYVCTDSREADENTLFVATRGERVDGHDYIVSALDLGCRCVLCEYVPVNVSGRRAAFVTVDNSIEAFAAAAGGYRQDSPIATVAVTGSVGKTTTKELVASILKRFLAVYSTVGNFNSVIGMPMSLMEVGEECDAAVFEMGMSGFGEISSMSRTARPRIAMVTNVGSSHLEHLGTRENIACAKLEIAEGLRDGGYLLLNGDERLLREIRPKAVGNVYKTLYIGLEDADDCQIIAKNIRVDRTGTVFDLEFLGRLYKDLKINLIGRHFAYNASFAASAAFLLGADEASVREGLLDYKSEGMRQDIRKCDGVTLVVDCYNAAPESMRGAIDTLCALSVEGKRVAVLGDMRELGESSEEMHREIGRYLVSRGIDMLITVGKLGAYIAESAILSGMSPSCVVAQVDEGEIDSVCSELRGRLASGDAVLFKASRAISLERVIDKVFYKD